MAYPSPHAPPGAPPIPLNAIASEPFMPFRPYLPPGYLPRGLTAGRAIRPLLLCLLALGLFAWTQPSYALDAVNPRAYAGYIIQLEGEPVAATYAALSAEQLAQTASVAALTQAQLAAVDQAQLQMVATLATYDAQVLYRVQRVYNGIAVYAPVDQAAALATLPGVQAVYPLIPKEPNNARVDQLLGMPKFWEGLNSAGLTGKGVSIAIIDTGVDYLHTMFGGPGTGYLDNDDTVVGDVANFPGAKVVGGYDFAGDEYDATPSSINFEPIPTPDPDPMDCYTFGHGTHVAGTAAGYGVGQDGATYDGPYDSSMSLTGLRIGPGLAPEAAIYALKVFGCSGSSNVVDAAVEWAVDPNQDGDFSDHVDVINLSLGSPFGATFDATAVAVENAARLGIIVVTSAGNSGDVHYAVGSPGIAPHAIAVAATSIDSTNPENFVDGAIASFSARGPRRGDDGLKPDLAAPGVNIVSAKRGTGSQSTTSSGTSMASPVVAGIMALLRQAHPEFGTPGWNSQELKALVMNTAAYPLLRADDSGPYSLLRAGAGRVDPTNALQSHLIAYDATAPAQVSVSFGVVEALDNTNELRAIRLANKSTAPISVTVAYSPVSELAGVKIDVGVGRVITIPALGAATIPITLTINAAELARHPDPARQVSPTDSQPWVDEASGYVSFTPLNPESGPAIHLPILALPRAISALEALSPPLVVSDTVTTTFPLTISGTAITATLAPTHSVPLVGLFGLLHSSPPITQTIDGEPPLGRYAQADLRYLGVAGPLIVDDEPMLYFALVSYGAWSTPLDATYQIAIDTNGDDISDFILQNRESTDISTFDLVTTDDFVSLLQPAMTPRKIQGPLNIFLSTQYDTRPYDNNVMILPLHLNQLGSNLKSIQLQVTSSSRDLINTGSSTLIEQTPTLSLGLADGAGVVTDQGLPLFPVVAGQPLTVTIDRTAYVRQNTKGLLVLYLHNELSTRSQVLPVDVGWSYQQILPNIRK